jgi:hypothetical protein
MTGTRSRKPLDPFAAGNGSHKIATDDIDGLNYEA